MWYTRLAYKPATHKILEQKQLRKTLPFQVEEEPNLETSPEPSPVDQPDNTTPDQPIAEIPQEITPDIPLLPGVPDTGPHLALPLPSLVNT